MLPAERETAIEDLRAAPRRWAWPHLALLTAVAVSIAGFILRFDPTVDQRWVDCLWLLALFLWIAEVRHAAGPPLIELPLRRADLPPIVLLLVAFAAAWLPFYRNWRWAFTGDSLTWFAVAWSAARGGLTRNLLSVIGGVDNNFTYLHSLAFNGLLFVFGPHFFWHRVGKLIVSCLSLAVIYGYFTLSLGRWWALAIAFCTAANYVWLWFSYVSYGHIDSHIFYFLTLTFALLIVRRADRLGAWMLCGLVGGLALFFTQTSWSAVLAVGVTLGLWGLATRRFQALLVYAISFLLAGLPMLLQPRGLLAMASRQSQSTYDLEYLTRIFKTILLLPYQFFYDKLGVQGAFLRPPLGAMYLVGTAVAALGAVPILRRRLRIPAIAPVLLALLLWDAVLLTLTNNAYGQPSTKRSYNLIPLQVFFALLPAIVLHSWVRASRWASRAVVCLVLAALGVYATLNLRLILYPAPAVYGINVFDELIELHQRFPERRVILASSRNLKDPLARDGLFNEIYGILDRLRVESDFSDALVEHTCSEQAILCYEPNFDKERMGRILEAHRDRLRPFRILNSVEAVCLECSSEPS